MVAIEGTMIALEYLIIGGALTILCLWLEKFEPPIKKQWIALVLFGVGAISAHFYLGNALYGFLISGIIYYKKELALEIKEILSSIKDIQKDTEDTKNNID